MEEEYKNGKVVGKVTGTLFCSEGKETASLIRRYIKYILINIKCVIRIHFWARSQNCEKRLLVSSRLPVCPAVRSYGTTRLPLERFS